MRLVYVSLVVAGLMGIAAADAAGDEPERINLSGFSIAPPAGDRWVAQKETGHPSIQALFIRDIRKERKALGLEKHHSFIVMTTGDVIPNLPYEDADKLLQSFAEVLKNQWQPERLKSISVSLSPGAADYSRSPFCVDYHLTAEDEDRISGQSRKVFILTERGKLCLHLTHPEYVIGLSYSQRSYRGEWIDAFDTEVARFLSGLKFMPVRDLWPYVAEQLENYSRALFKVNNQAEAQTIKKHAGSLKEASTGKGSHLGFDPAADLEAYSKFLTARGDDSGAQRMSILARKWFYNNAMAAGISYETLLESQRTGN